jgi:hypothetical protein
MMIVCCDYFVECELKLCDLLVLRALGSISFLFNKYQNLSSSTFTLVLLCVIFESNNYIIISFEKRMMYETPI